MIIIISAKWCVFILVQQNWYYWPNVRPMIACYLNIKHFRKLNKTWCGFFYSLYMIVWKCMKYLITIMIFPSFHILPIFINSDLKLSMDVLVIDCLFMIIIKCLISNMICFLKHNQIVICRFQLYFIFSYADLIYLNIWFDLYEIHTTTFNGKCTHAIRIKKIIMYTT